MSTFTSPTRPWCDSPHSTRPVLHPTPFAPITSPRDCRAVRLPPPLPSSTKCKVPITLADDSTSRAPDGTGRAKQPKVASRIAYPSPSDDAANDWIGWLLPFPCGQGVESPPLPWATVLLSGAVDRSRHGMGSQPLGLQPPQPPQQPLQQQQPPPQLLHGWVRGEDDGVPPSPAPSPPPVLVVAPSGGSLEPDPPRSLTLLGLDASAKAFTGICGIFGSRQHMLSALLILVASAATPIMGIHSCAPNTKEGERCAGGGVLPSQTPARLQG